MSGFNPTKQAVPKGAVLDVIGMTEVMYGFISNRTNQMKLGSSGLAIISYDVKLVGETGAVVERAGSGSLLVRGAGISSHYWNKLDRAAEALQDGRLKIGDIFRRDDDGYYFFAGRSDGLFKSSAMWAIALRPGCNPDDATAAAIAAHGANVLPRHKRPQAVRIVDAIPRTATGKLQRFQAACRRSRTGSKPKRLIHVVCDRCHAIPAAQPCIHSRPLSALPLPIY